MYKLLVTRKYYTGNMDSKTSSMNTNELSFGTQGEAETAYANLKAAQNELKGISVDQVVTRLYSVP